MITGYVPTVENVLYMFFDTTANALSKSELNKLINNLDSDEFARSIYINTLFKFLSFFGNVAYWEFDNCLMFVLNIGLDKDSFYYSEINKSFGHNICTFAYILYNYLISEGLTREEVLECIHEL